MTSVDGVAAVVPPSVEVWVGGVAALVLDSTEGPGLVCRLDGVGLGLLVLPAFDRAARLRRPKIQDTLARVHRSHDTGGSESAGTVHLSL